jgi:hypothetical protein
MSRTTDALIADLAGKLEPVPRGAAARRIGLGLLLGAAMSAGLMMAWLGIRPDVAKALATPMFWVKFAYTALTGLLFALALTRVARPGVRLGRLAALIAAPLAILVLMAALRLASTDPTAWRHLLMGGSADLCPWRIFVIGLPVLAGAMWAVRGLAPTELTLAGLVAGGCAGSFGAAIYAFACDETAAPFVAIWYTLGMAAVAVVGGLAGSRILRWR